MLIACALPVYSVGEGAICIAGDLNIMEDDGTVLLKFNGQFDECMLVVQVLEELVIECCLDKTDMNVELVLVIWCCVKPIGWRILVRCLAIL